MESAEVPESGTIEEFADVVINEEGGVKNAKKFPINNLKKKNKAPAVTGSPGLADFLQQRVLKRKKYEPVLTANGAS